MRITPVLLALLMACGGGSPARDVPSEGISDSPHEAPSGSRPPATAAGSRPPVYAGTFYPADPGVLASMVDSLLDSASSSLRGSRAVAGVVPHAGYVYSGATAADLFGSLRGMDIDVVVLVGPSHRTSFNGFSVFQGTSCLTPLGEVPVDTDMAGRLLESHPSAAFTPRAHEAEHCLEVQLPFLQRSLDPGFRIVPVLVGSADAGELEFMAELILAEAFERRVLVLASCDLSHYPPLEMATRVDSATVSAILAGDPEGFLSSTSEESLPEGVDTFACGRLPVALAMYYSRFFPGTSAEVLSMTTSAEFSGDDERVVGYASILFFSEEPDPSEWMVSETSSDLLLELARGSVEAAVAGGAFDLPSELPDELTVPRGAFVTLKSGGMLRGCIGSIRPSGPLAETVVRMARSAALEDPRFPPVSPAELDGISFEVSVLTPLQMLEDPDRVRVGTDGLLIIGPGGRSGVLLPQVPVEQGWNREDFLEGVCIKAGLSPNAYTGDVLLYRFQAQVIDEYGEDRRQR
ncbi:MAG: hypothetical protein AVO35_09535 [Candidatus Aegiribacteria sp. MLS_C]|nr:MAG: hypothetical protein AVO35_09535 [Candidatus Aegiribacteria sp. MLS_C]